LTELPIEIILIILQNLSTIDITRLRLVSKGLCTICDYPIHWKRLILRKPDQENGWEKNEAALSLWELRELKEIIEPHLCFIESLYVWGVRDNIVQYLVLNCPTLKELTIYGWFTLSDHSLKVPEGKILSLQKLRLVSSPKSLSNFTSLDASTLGKFISQCPNLTDLLLVCQINFQADALLQSFSSKPSLSLESLVVTTKRCWSSHHVTRVFEYCPALSLLGLVP
ncbi:hypothetical protein K501DRAFT_141054, partial [Backusella circina FSU 941]